MSETKPLRRGGPAKTLIGATRYNLELPEYHRKIIEDYARKHQTSSANAVRRAIELLEKQDAEK